MTDAERLADVAAILGPLGSRTDWQGRAMYLAYLIVSKADEAQVAEAREQVEALKPGFLNRAQSLKKQEAAARV